MAGSPIACHGFTRIDKKLKIKIKPTPPLTVTHIHPFLWAGRFNP
jgi:hypothetical protein